VRNHGFSVVEMLFATVILTVLIASVFDLVNPARGTFQAQPETADLQQRLRVAVDTIASSMRAAGSGSLVGASRGPLARSVPSVLPYRIGESNSDPAAGVWYRPDVISLVSVPLTGAQAVLHDPAPRGATLLTLTLPASCPPATASSICGFAAGTRALVYDATGAWDAITVAEASGNTLVFARPGGLTFAYRAGAIVTEVVIRSFSLKADALGVPHLSQYDGFQAEFPVVDNVVSLAFEYFGAPDAPALLAQTPLEQPMGPWTTYGPRPPPAEVDDGDDGWPMGENCVFQLVDGHHVPRLPSLGAGLALVRISEAALTDGPWCPDTGSPSAYDADLLRIRRVRVKLRVQVASASLRGPVGTLFLRAGRSTSAERFVPDQQIEFDVAPPNMAFGR
jgi:hypothetical protein